MYSDLNFWNIYGDGSMGLVIQSNAYSSKFECLFSNNSRTPESAFSWMYRISKSIILSPCTILLQLNENHSKKRVNMNYFPHSIDDLKLIVQNELNLLYQFFFLTRPEYCKPKMVHLASFYINTSFHNNHILWYLFIK